MHDVRPAPGPCTDADCMHDRFRLRLGRASLAVPRERGLAALQGISCKNVYDFTVLGVHHYDRAAGRRGPCCAEDRLVVDHERALVRHEDLEARDPSRGQLHELPLRLGGVDLRHDHVKTDVNDQGDEHAASRARGRVRRTV